MNGSMGHVGTTRIEKGGVCPVCTGVALLSSLGLLRIELFEETQHNHQPTSLLAMISRACDPCCRRCTESFLQTTQRSKQQTSFFLRHEMERQMRERGAEVRRRRIPPPDGSSFSLLGACWEGQAGKLLQARIASRIPSSGRRPPPTGIRTGRVRLGIAGITEWVD